MSIYVTHDDFLMLLGMAITIVAFGLMFLRR